MDEKEKEQISTRIRSIFPQVNGKTCIENAPHFRLPKQKKNVHHLVIFIIKFELPFSKTRSNKMTQSGNKKLGGGDEQGVGGELK